LQGKVEEAFGYIGIKISNFRQMFPQDIFETSFGKGMLAGIEFDLADFNLRFPSGKQYTLTCSMSLTALGACTVFFKIKITPDMSLGVEDIRALQSTICPHAGQVELFVGEQEDDLRRQQEKHNISRIPSKHQLSIRNERFLERVDMIELRKNLSDLDDYLNIHKIPRSLKECKVLTEEVIDTMLDSWAKATEEQGDEKVKKLVNELAKLIIELYEFGDSSKAERLLLCCNKHRYLYDLGHWFLDTMESAFHEACDESLSNEFKERERWCISTDTGWHVLLSAYSISEAWRLPDGTFSQKEETSAPPIEKLISHPDLMGFIIEQREARSSFDDWRFVKQNYDDRENLAYFRSHASDAFFGSQYQAFVYLPADPYYIQEQYDFTVMIMMWLNANHHYYSRLADLLGLKIRRHLTGNRGDKMTARDVRSMIKVVTRLNTDAHELHNRVNMSENSRYRDHGELMIEVLRRMKLDKKIEALDRRLNNIKDLYDQALLDIRAKRDLWMTALAKFIAFILAIQSIDIIMENVDRIPYFEGYMTTFTGFISEIIPALNLLPKNHDKPFIVLMSVGLALSIILIWVLISQFFNLIWKSTLARTVMITSAWRQVVQFPMMIWKRVKQIAAMARNRSWGG
jgi:hypothetical protein